MTPLIILKRLLLLTTIIRPHVIGGQAEYCPDLLHLHNRGVGGRAVLGRVQAPGVPHHGQRERRQPLVESLGVHGPDHPLWDRLQHPEIL